MIYRLLAVLVGAFMWAKLEVEIEGKDGWAANLPTWRLEKHILLDLLMNGRPMTGYHLWAFSFVGFAYHLPFLWMTPWSWRAECGVLGCLALFWVVEDFLWFMLNPHFGWRRYREQNISWHRSWFLGIPADHWGLLAVGFVLLYVS